MGWFRRKSGGEHGRLSQSGGSWTTLLFLILVSVLLAAYNAYSTARDVRLATGPEGAAQRAFFIEAADRPDILTLYQGMTREEKLAAARNIARYDHPKLAKLVAVLLQDFDAEARKALTETLRLIAARQPKAVAEELKNSSSFQYLGVTAALRSLGEGAIPYVVETLSNGDCRPRAIEFLVNSGAAAIPLVLPKLQATDKDVRLAAVEALGKLRAREAAAPIRKLFYEAPRADRMPYLTALATIAAPEDEGLLQAALNDAAYPTPLRAQAALGLGRIASPTAVRTLWRATGDRDPELVEAAVAGLRLAEDRALLHGSGSPKVVAEVCAGFETPLSNRTLATLLAHPDRAVLDAAVVASRGREALVGPLAAVLARANPEREGELVEAVVDALYSTEPGRQALAKATNPVVRSFIERRKLIETFGST
ncbi:MAG: HEAT repeat domain-containing protein [Fimbriimonadaceae bacterium]